jgi:hypothetical protein
VRGDGGEVLRSDDEEGVEAPGGGGVGAAGRRVLRSHALAPAPGEHGPRRGAPRQHVRGARQDAAGAVRGHRQPRPRARHTHLHIPLRQATVRHRPGLPPIASASPLPLRRCSSNRFGADGAMMEILRIALLLSVFKENR